ncbi:hypothetical protein [Sandaracinus amylolyticus]|uniref:Uncharacterized protein n=1 Tax=Sandaracinus amylolyticus TaxID=927083 RepID=A0A0F6W3J9_9BACT|nr:hypothetical protein [Sandaracinus amylolyticus]AKF06402.1 hypothetical protein DB32_003551 [Sandaracinus amylolyticus]
MRVRTIAVWLVLAVACSESHEGGDDAGSTAMDASARVDASARADSGARPDASVSGECDVPSECVLLPESCCGTCGAPTPDDMIAVHRDDVDEHQAMACADPVACPGCVMELDPYLIATCRAGECVALDLHVEALTECTGDDECTLAPAQCCACGLLGVGETIAFNPERGSLNALVCDPVLTCPPCAPVFEGLEARCESGRCIVATTGG